MQVYLLKDVAHVGFAGEIIKVSDGYAKNFLFPRSLAVELTAHNIGQYQAKVRKVENRKEAIATETSMRAEQIKESVVTISSKTHDNGKLYGAISAQDIVDALAAQCGIKVAKTQVLIDKSIKAIGNHSVTIHLSSRLQPQMMVKIVAEKE